MPDELSRRTFLGTALAAAATASIARPRHGRPKPPSWVFPGAALDLDFARSRGWSSDSGSTAVADQLTVDRSTPGYWRDTAGAWQAFAANALRRTDDGVGIENAGANHVAAADFAGVQKGRPGALPNGWTINVPGGHDSGLSTEIVGVGVDHNLPYLDVRYFGTTSADSGEIQFVPGPATAAASGQTWTFSVFLQIVAGTFAGTFGLYVNELTGSGGYIDSLPVYVTPTNSFERFANTSQLRNGSVGRTQAVIDFFAPASGTSVDFTVRFFCPQLEHAAGPTSPMPGGSRTADRIGPTPGGALAAALAGHQGMVRLEFGPVAQAQAVSTLLDAAGFVRLDRTDDRTVQANTVTVAVGTVGFAAETATGSAMLAWSANGRWSVAANGSAVHSGSKARPTADVLIGNQRALDTAVNTSLKRITLWGKPNDSVLPPYTSCFDNPFSTITKPTYFTGVNLAGLDFGSVPGTYNRDYFPPTLADYRYVSSKGFTYVRVPYKLERLFPDITRPTVFGADTLSALDQAVNEGTSRGMAVQLDPHNYCGYQKDGSTHPLGSDPFTVERYAQMLGTLAERYGRNPLVHFNLMNEPTSDTEPGMTAQIWRQQAEAAIAAIRATGTKNKIIIPGVGYTGAWTWVDKGNADAWTGFRDVNFAFDVHQYLDSNGSGTHESVVTGAGSTRLQYDFHDFENTGKLGVTPWAREHGYQLILSEFGTTRNVDQYPQAPVELEALLGFIDDNRDVFLGWAWWAESVHFGDYFFNLYPDDIGLSTQHDQVQMATLVKHQS